MALMQCTCTGQGGMCREGKCGAYCWVCARAHTHLDFPRAAPAAADVEPQQAFVGGVELGEQRADPVALLHDWLHLAGGGMGPGNSAC